MPYVTPSAEEIHAFIRKTRKKKPATRCEQQFISLIGEIVFLLNAGQDFYSAWRYLNSKWESQKEPHDGFMSPLTFSNICARLRPLIWSDDLSEDSLPHEIPQSCDSVGAPPCSASLPPSFFDEKREEWKRFFAVMRDFNLRRRFFPRPHYRRDAFLS